MFQRCADVSYPRFLIAEASSPQLRCARLVIVSSVAVAMSYEGHVIRPLKRFARIPLYVTTYIEYCLMQSVRLSINANYVIFYIYFFLGVGVGGSSNSVSTCFSQLPLGFDVGRTGMIGNRNP